MRGFVGSFTFFSGLVFWLITFSPVRATETQGLEEVLKKVDQLVCKKPKEITRYYDKNLVIMSDDKRIFLERRIEDYERMIAEYEEMRCKVNRKVLGGGVSEGIGYVLMDELISVQSRLSTDERQHSFCNYVFHREDDAWKIVLEQCASLPDYNILPGEDALYYFHNPVY